MTGTTKHDDFKLRYDLLPVDALEELVHVYTMGARKYGDHNWRIGTTWGRFFAAMMRHAWAWWGGEELDDGDGQHHLASVAWCALALMTYEMEGLGTDDRPANLVTVPDFLSPELEGLWDGGLLEGDDAPDPSTMGEPRNARST